MKDILQDIVAHTHQLGIIPLVKITSNTNNTEIEAMAEDRSVIVTGTTKTPIGGFEGVFGMPNLNKLAIHLNCPEYKEKAKITVTSAERNGEVIPTGLHFENEAGDFQNDYRFMNTEIINERLKTVKFKGAQWNIEFEPNAASVQRLKFQANANSEETLFQVSTENDNLIFNFGDASTHAGNFVFQSGITGKLKQTWSWPVTQVISILGLTGDMNIKISDQGAMQITVDSGLATYNYILPAQTK
jgi:hypothetical protein